MLGEVRPRGTPDHIVAALPHGLYREWAAPGESETRCPICLDDYQPEDPVLKISDCSHWFHKGCIEVGSPLCVHTVLLSDRYCAF
ncbi:hypothetical protein IEO21_07437 [Rhodonia placenta]|uniref:RING-type domain-containing protein n=1 Tax=Rhodonia placenta TaxID=104341 RepID=A0A8H7NY09_9APHY|nr:hypothetical protein IEO21_07437 [Postia placenta]